MIDILYISDVDGTLTRGTNLLSDETARLLRAVVGSGVNIALATGRSLNGVSEIVQRGGIIYPVIVLNGAMIYDMKNNKAIKLFPIRQPAALELCRIYQDAGIGFTTNIFIEKEQRTKAFFNYEKNYPWPQKAINTKNGLYHDERLRVDKILPHIGEGECLYFGSADTKERIEFVYKEMQKVPGTKGYYHQSPYDENKWFLDVVAEDSGKGVAALYLKELYNAKELVTFGDNHNDLPMLQLAQRSYTVPEAPDEVKAAVTAVLEDDPNCVLKFIMAGGV